VVDAVPVALVNPEEGLKVAVNPVCAVPVVQTTGSPACPVLTDIVMVIGALPATKLVTPPYAPTLAVVDAAEYIVYVGPVYEAGDVPASTTVVENVPVGAGLDAGEATGVIEAVMPEVMLKPGSRPEPDPELH